MAYLGGKAKNSNHIITVLNDPIFDNSDYLEPFMGYCHILRRVVNKKSYSASDANPLVVSLFKGIQKKLPIPPISKKRYYTLKGETNNYSFERAVACFTMSYNGKAWGGYVRNNKKSPSFLKTGKLMDYRKQRINYYKSLQENPTFMKTKISLRSYSDIKPISKLIYCDPPYQGTTAYDTSDTGEFDHTSFWEMMRKWSRNNIVFISEYNAPADFIVVSKSNKITTITREARVPTRTEKLFIHKSLQHILPSISTR